MYDAYLYSNILTRKWHIEPDIPLLFSKASHCLPFEKCGAHMRDPLYFSSLFLSIIPPSDTSYFWFLGCRNSVCFECTLHPPSQTCLDKTQTAKAVPLASSLCADGNSSALRCGLAWWPWATSESLGGSGRFPLSSWHCRTSYLLSNARRGPDSDITFLSP